MEHQKHSLSNASFSSLECLPCFLVYFILFYIDLNPNPEDKTDFQFYYATLQGPG